MCALSVCSLCVNTALDCARLWVERPAWSTVQLSRSQRPSWEHKPTTPQPQHPGGHVATDRMRRGLRAGPEPGKTCCRAWTCRWRCSWPQVLRHLPRLRLHRLSAWILCRWSPARGAAEAAAGLHWRWSTIAGHEAGFAGGGAGMQRYRRRACCSSCCSAATTPCGPTRHLDKVPPC